VGLKGISPLKGPKYERFVFFIMLKVVTQSMLGGDLKKEDLKFKLKCQFCKFELKNSGTQIS